MILAVIEERQYIPSEHKQHEIWTKLQHSIKEDELPVRKIAFWSAGYKVAASVLLLVTAIASWWFLKKDSAANLSIASVELNVVKEFNNSNHPKTIVLGDGSSIILKPQSSLEFPKVFDLNYREVKLSGEAFFEVAKDPKRPFLVHADQLITKVLGTSFNIRAFENEKNVSVQVKTGKVSVYTESDAQTNKNKGNAQLEGVLLTPNQQVIFSREELRMVKSLVDNPSLLNSTNKENFEFKDTPLRDVFATLEQAYGIDIIYDEEVMQDCALNASLEDMLRLICKGVNARYEILDSHIVISGKGCR
jgi:ferric-dicitrate binding protein FerR (iron transport regulator)